MPFEIWVISLRSHSEAFYKKTDVANFFSMLNIYNWEYKNHSHRAYIYFMCRRKKYILVNENEKLKYYYKDTVWQQIWPEANKHIAKPKDLGRFSKNTDTLDFTFQNPFINGFRKVKPENLYFKKTSLDLLVFQYAN